MNTERTNEAHEMGRKTFIASSATPPLAGVASSQSHPPIDRLYAAWRKVDAAYKSKYCEATFERIIALEDQIAKYPATTARDFAVKIVVASSHSEFPDVLIERSLVADAQRLLD